MMNGKQYAGIVVLLVLMALVIAAPAAAQNPPPPVVRLEVNPPTAKAGDVVTVAVKLDNVTELYGLQVTCQVDPTALVGTSRVEGDAFNSTNSFYVDQGMKPEGKWLIAATRLQPNPAFNGNGTAFTFQYTMQSVVNTTLTCTALGVDSHSMPLPLTLANGTLTIAAAIEPTAVAPTEVQPTIEAPTATEVVPTEVVPTVEPSLTPEATEIVPTPEATPVVGSSSTIQGVVINQFAPDSSGLQVQLTANGSLVQQSSTGADGAFSFADVPPGSYVLLVSAPEHLALVYNITVAGDGAAVDLGSQTFVTGDTDGNQTIDLADAALISANFDLAAPPAPESADLNHDGQVNVSDLVLIGTNFGLSGPIQVK
jgi:hypothetical protein